MKRYITILICILFISCKNESTTPNLEPFDKHPILGKWKFKESFDLRTDILTPQTIADATKYPTLETSHYVEITADGFLKIDYPNNPGNNIIVKITKPSLENTRDLGKCSDFNNSVKEFTESTALELLWRSKENLLNDDLIIRNNILSKNDDQGTLYRYSIDNDILYLRKLIPVHQLYCYLAEQGEGEPIGGPSFYYEKQTDNITQQK